MNSRLPATPLRILPVLVVVYCILAFFLWLQVPVWNGQQKAFLLAIHLLLFLPGWAVAARRLARASLAEPERPFPEFHLPGLPTMLALSFCALAGIGGYLSRSVELSDESVYLFQADAIRSGHLSAPGPPQEIIQDGRLRRSFAFTHNLVVGERWFGKYPPGFPAALAVAQSLGVQRILNSVFSWVALCLAAWIALTFWGQSAAKWTILLLVLSPYFVLNAAGWYSHNLAALLVAAATAAAVRSGRSSPIAWISVSVAPLALCLLVRPFTTVLMGAVIVCYLCTIHWGRRKVLAAGLAVWSAAGISAAVAYLYLQRELTGSWLVSPYSLYYGAGAIPKEINVHPLSILKNLATITGPSLADTLLCTFPLVVPIAAWGLWYGLRRRLPSIWMPAALFACLVAGYTIQTESSTSSIGERYYYEGYFGAVLAVVAMGTIHGRRFAGFIGPRKLVLLLAISVIVPWTIYTKIIVDTRRPYVEMERAARTFASPTSLVYLGSTGSEFMASWLNLNRYSWNTDGVLYLIDPGPEYRDRVAAILKRPRWVVLDWSPKEHKPVLADTAQPLP